MKRTLTSLVLICVVAAVAGWVAAQTRNLYREHRATVEAEQSRLAVEAKAKKLASMIAELARGADEVELSWFGRAEETGKTKIRFSDAAWQARFASILADATFTPTAHILAVSDPAITFYRKNTSVLFLMGGVVTPVINRDESGNSEFRIAGSVAAAILALVAEKDSRALGSTNLPSATVQPASHP